MLQQHLPFTVLKLVSPPILYDKDIYLLQQHLPFTVLKRAIFGDCLHILPHLVATALTVYGIETWPCAATNLRYD